MKHPIAPIYDRWFLKRRTGVGMIRYRIVRHFSEYETRSPWSFYWRITLEGFVASLAAWLLMVLIFLPAERPGPYDPDLLVLFGQAVVLAPVIETLLCQAIPLFFVRACGGGFRWQLVVSALAFGVPHSLVSARAAIGATVAGFYLAYTYVHWRKTSGSAAFWITTASHALHNLATLIVAVLVKSL